MIIFTARIPKRRLLAGTSAALCCVFAVLAFALTLGGRAVAASAEVKNIKDNDDRLAYLSGLGWQTSSQPIATEELLIPEEFDESYTGYLQLQADQGFDLTQYKGRRGKRVTHPLTNHPPPDGPGRDSLPLYKKPVVGGQIQSSSGSFLHGLSLPGPASAQPSPAPSQTASGQTIR